MGILLSIFWLISSNLLPKNVRDNSPIKVKIINVINISKPGISRVNIDLDLWILGVFSPRY